MRFVLFSFHKFQSAILLFALVVIFSPSGPEAFNGEQSVEKCLDCHEGIARVSRSHPKKLGCVICHGGQAESEDKEEAHSTLIFDPDAGSGKRNPSTMKVVHLSCGQAQCHSGYEDSDRNHVDRFQKSMMGTLSGIISGLRFQWGGQSVKTSKYGYHSVTDDDGWIPEKQGALKQLQALPHFSPKDLQQVPIDKRETEKVSFYSGDLLLRKNCLQCHVDAPPPPGVYRSQGCAACHFYYAKSGKYLGKDRMISKIETGHPAYHKMSALPQKRVCTQCHKNFALETARGQSQFPGAGRVRKDIHFEKGLECIDCHTQFDIMGDGNIYSKQFQAVEVRCETCHGDSKTFPLIAKITDPEDQAIRLSRHYNGFRNKLNDWMVLSSKKRKLSNVKVEEKNIVTYGKRTGKKHIVPLIGKRKGAHGIAQHQEKLECIACHSQWVPGCSDCQIVFDAKRNAVDAINQKLPKGNQPFKLTVTEPALMVGPRGKVMPMLSGSFRTLTVLDEKSKPVSVIGFTGDSLGTYRDWRFTNPMGYSGSNTALAIHPHSVGKKVRACASCHLSPKTLGLGSGDLSIGKRSSGGRDRMKPLDRSHVVKGISKLAPQTKVTVRGKAVAGTSQPGARPFNQGEITRILKVGNCISCHDRYDDPIYRDIEKSYKLEKTAEHRKLRKKFFK